jgi:hypothetical protein
MRLEKCSLQSSSLAYSSKMHTLRNVQQSQAYLIGQVEVADADRHLPDIVPHVGHVFVRRERQRLLKARQRHVVLRRVEAAETNVVPQLGVGHAHLAKRHEIIKRHVANVCRLRKTMRKYFFDCTDFSKRTCRRRR